MNYDGFIGQVRSRGRLSSLGDAVKATRAVLETLSERLPLDEVKDLAAQLPSEIAYYLRQRSAFLDKFGLDDFFKRVSEREPADLPVATYHARVVISVIKDAVTPGEMEDIRAQLPAEFAPLFETGWQGEMKKAA
ncbi:MAG: hypothetical protein A2010_07120 [Nitrospirae bacterium GWD2_57_9]|nr:MAG: hypothetical protein A2010_07120 [Nitrospirae bacterium GWD2_57_9]OGW47209.1 MAG: hypothetical protein A2078_01865 [Nitrospirae bacterium GWC2_57_9]